MKTFFLSDTHGSVLDIRIYIIHLSKLVNETPFRIIQLGDFGYCDNTGDIGKVNNLCKKYNCYLDFIDGNHEDFDYMENMLNLNIHSPTKQFVKSNINYLGRGYTEIISDKKVIFFGGAGSFDRFKRKPTKWWQQEKILDLDIANIRVDDYDLMVSHDAPVGETLGSRNAEYEERYGNMAAKLYVKECNDMYMKALCKINPKIVVHGHYHHTYEEMYESYTWCGKVVGLNHVNMKSMTCFKEFHEVL